MSLRDQLQIASFDGIPFYWQSHTTTVGSKSITHEYPNGTKRKIDFIGTFEDVFSVNGVIADIDGIDYLTLLSRLETAFNQPGLKILVLPIGGSIQVVAKRPVSITQTKNDLGRATFTVTFEQSESTVDSPQAESANQGEILSFNEQVNADLNLNLADNFNISSGFPDNFDNALDIIGQSIDLFDAIGQEVANISEQASIFNSQIDTALREIISLTNEPILLGNAVRGLYDQFILLNDNAKTRVNALARFFDFGDDFVSFPSNTASRIEKKKNQDLLILQMQATGLSQSYNDISLAEFDNIEELESFSDLLNNQYLKIIELPELDQDSRVNLSNLRQKTREFFDRERLSAPQIKTINTPKIPLTRLVYQYYGELDNLDQDIIDLNMLRGNVSEIEGDIRILSP